MKILVVDDDDSMRVLTSTVLQKSGIFEVIQAASGQEVLGLARQHRPDAIIMDVLMDDMDGLTVFKALLWEKNLRDTPVIFLTGRDDKVECQKYLESGVRAVISKPYDPARLADQINKILGSGKAV